MPAKTRPAPVDDALVQLLWLATLLLAAGVVHELTRPSPRGAPARPAPEG